MVLTYRICIWVITVSLGVSIVMSQQKTPPTTERGGQSDAYRVSAAIVLGSRPSAKTSSNKQYRSDRPFTRSNPNSGKKLVTVGLTFSRARPATDIEINNAEVAKVKGCIQWLEKKCVSRQDMVLARMTGATAVSDRDQIQLSIEYLSYLDRAGRKRANDIGYLYVINREQYPNGRYSRPRLIFPTLNTYEGDNRVLPGRTVAMPEPERPWTISRSESRTVQAFETYTVIVSSQPLKDLAGAQLQLDTSPLIIEEQLLNLWLEGGGTISFRGDLEGGEGQLISQRELKSSGPIGQKRRATTDDKDDLKQDDPAPQMIFSSPIHASGKLVVIVRLPYKEKSE